MKIATWNVNSIQMRLSHVLEWLRKSDTDILLLQETKVQDEDFPKDALEAIGYQSLVCGQRRYNGVAILSRLPILETARSLPGSAGDTQARYIEACVNGQVRVASLYSPNGNPINSSKFYYKLAWMDRLYERAKTLLQNNEAVILGGDYNICPTDDDVYSPNQLANDALCQLESREAFRAILWLGYNDAFRVFNRQPGEYTFWDYRANAWIHNMGLRTDHVLLSPKATDLLEASGIDREPRSQRRASDHTPLWCQLTEERNNPFSSFV